MRQNEAMAVHLNGHAYIDLTSHLWKQRDTRTPDQIVAIAVKEWMARNQALTIWIRRKRRRRRTD